MRLLIFVVALVLVSGTFTPAFCQGALEPTSAVKVGQYVTIRTVSGDPVKGWVSKVTKEGILVDAGKRKGSLQVASSDIVRINRQTSGKSALIGLGVGAGIGFAVGASNPVDIGRIPSGSFFGAVFGGIGAGVGAVIGIDRTVYRKQ